MRLSIKRSIKNVTEDCILKIHNRIKYCKNNKFT